jgi:hypothetical protein
LRSQWNGGFSAPPDPSGGDPAGALPAKPNYKAERRLFGDGVCEAGRSPR